AALPRPAPLPVLPSGRAPSPRRSPTRPSRAYEPPPFAQRDPWTGSRPSFLTDIRRSYPVAGA
ncbi:MAG: hypothetical protein KGJ69_01060, partial [Thermoplasmata archaeon]|nr:hypothetical protein [Thermoplasmata archaeon]